MQSLFSFAARKETTPSSVSGGQPEALRRKAMATNTHFLLAASFFATPFAFMAMIHGVVMPFALVVLGLAQGFLSLGLQQRGRHDHAAATLVYGTLLAGFIMTMTDPAIADFGLAVALLGPVHASLSARSSLQARSWVVLAAIVVLAVFNSSSMRFWPEVYRPEFRIVGGIAFAVIGATVAYSASRMSSAFEVYDKSQINAYRHLIEHVQDAVLRFSAEGTLLFISRSSEALFGCRRFELAAGGLAERLHVLDRPLYLTAFADVNQGGKSRTIEVRMRRDDPTAPARAPQFIWIEMALSPVFESSTPKSQHEIVALLRDITDRKDRDNEMRQARKAAEEASNAKSRFLATIGHELRTPLNAIIGFSEMMTSDIGGELSPTHREYAQLIGQSGHHLIEVVKMLLDMSRIEAGKFELQTEPFSPDAIVAPCLQMVEGLAVRKSVRILTDVPRALPQITADERACRQILINLLSNAIKFSHDKGLVTVSMRRQGQSINISVTDRGIGMGPDSVSRIGEAFFQAQDGLARHYEGTGLGLSIVKGLVDLHGGTLHVASEAGLGTIMTVLLPINGPAIKVEDTGTVTPLYREPAQQQIPSWHGEKRKAQ
ncbi:MAG TPA: PAS domain-containing sensor histidine kinase [Arsenicitalea sp.]|jgi:cell cycle sensor histidine kinase DivJ|nr:PAS domain-containing sensor histidine kinase [Arsenicitalea sp.]